MATATTSRWGRRAVWGVFAAVLAVGCNPLSTIGFLLHKDTPLPAEHPLRPREGDGSDKDKELKVLVLCGMGNGVAADLAGSDGELARILAKMLPVLAKDNKENLSVVPPGEVDKYKMKHRNWRSMHATAIGKQLGADYVLEVTLGNVGLYQPQSGNRIYEGRAEVSVQVYEVAAGAGEPKYSYPHQYTYPKTGQMIAVDGTDVKVFKSRFLERLALELARKHIDYKQEPIGADR